MKKQGDEKFLVDHYENNGVYERIWRNAGSGILMKKNLNFELTGYRKCVNLKIPTTCR